MNQTKHPRRRSRLLRLALGLVASCGVAGCVPPRPSLPSMPAAVQREFRGVWVASVSNIDWPSRPGLSPDEQRAELLAMLDRAAALRLNAVILQVRPAADALYPSELEPWSEYLTGEMGRAPEPVYDPLQFAVDEAHRRGLELHAWFNPFRARHPSARSAIAPSHVSRARPELTRVYGRHLWMDPGEPAVQDHSLAVVLDVVRRYDVDGVHIDDYFYPYRERDEAGILIEFPDSASYARYRSGGGRLELGDWRRDNVDRFVERVYRGVKETKPWVKFGVSPIGTWRPGHPAGMRGFDAYEQIYADARKWLVNGWLDYFVPQLYWPIARADLSFPVLLRWWTEQNHARRHLWPGLIPNRVGAGSAPAWPASEIVGQILVARGNPGATGTVLFSARSLMQSPDSLAERLASGVFAEPALVPPSPWLGARAPGRPEVARYLPADSGAAITLEPTGREPTWLWALRARTGAEWRVVLAPGWQRRVHLPGRPEEVVVTAVGRTGVEGPPALLIGRTGPEVTIHGGTR